MPPHYSLPHLHTPSSPNTLINLKLNHTTFFHSKTLRLDSARMELPHTKHLSCNASGKFGVQKIVDVATLSNLCVDVVLNVPKLPPLPKPQRKAYMDQLAKSPPHKKFWEAGGNCNMVIAAARLGLQCVSIGLVGSEAYGEFLGDVLRDEGINIVNLDERNSDNNKFDADYETLICWVLVDPLQQHGFCSRADFLDEPALNWLSDLSTRMKTSIGQSKILFCNGFVFDELAPNVIESALDYAIEVGTSIFFDPGPRGKSLASGTPEEQKTLHKLLQMSDVLFLTSEEAESLTGIKDPILAGQEFFRKGVRTKWVIIKTGSSGSVLITMSSICCAPGFKVKVVDTVGCGDSFVAGVAFGYINSMPLMYTLTLANAVGAATAMGCGAGRNVATLEQVMELMKGANLNEDDKFWNELLGEQSDALDITMLSKLDVISSSKIKKVPIQKAVSELLPKLEAAGANNILH